MLVSPVKNTLFFPNKAIHNLASHQLVCETEVNNVDELAQSNWENGGNV
jgi:hypothetical protein